MSRAAAIGVDAGSTTCKAVLVDGDGRLLAHRLEPADPRIEAQAERLMAFIAQLRRSPIAIRTDAANAQHYEVPAEFYRLASISTVLR